MFKDKIVLVGTTALGTREVVSTPLDTLFAGVEVQATVADNLLQQDFIRRPEYAGVLETQLVIGLGLVSALLVRRFGLAWGAAGVAVCLAGVWFGSDQADGDERRLRLAALSDDGAAVGARGDDRRPLHERAAACRSGRRGEGDVAALMVQSLLSLTEVRDAETGKHSTPDASLHARARAAAVDEPGVPRLS